MTWDFKELQNIIANIDNNNVVDISLYDFVHPSLLVGLLSLYADKKIEIRWLWENHLLHNYLSRCNFYDIVWFEHQKVRRYKNDNLIEINSISWELTKDQIVDIEVTTTKILQSLWLDKHSINNLYNTFYWLLFELLYNITTHSRADFTKRGCLYMMQIFPQKWLINIVVADNGIGIKDSFKDSDYYDDNLWYEHYIDLAFQKWVTRDRNEWAGNGLYGTIEIIKNSMSQISMYSWDKIYIQNGLDQKIEDAPFWKWVFVDIRFNINNINSDIINQLMKNWVIKSPIWADEIEHLEDLFI